MEHDTRLELLALTSQEVEDAARTYLRSGAGIALTVYRQALDEGRFEPETLGVKIETARAWRERFRLTLPEVVKTIEEPSPYQSATIKVVLRLEDGLEIECVRIPMGPGKYTLCLSSQVGCKLACGFCETGRMGLLRNLSAAEIVSQVVVCRVVLGWSIRNLVFMGMGEPLDNIEMLIQSLRVLHDHRGLHFGQQRIKVCTVGLPEGIERLGRLGFRRMDLSISLNGAMNEKRSALMPINRRFPLESLQRALLAYPRRAGFAFGVNYCLMPGINDGRDDASAVARFCAPLGKVMLNVIPYNPGSTPLVRAPTEEEVVRFIRWLDEDGLPVRRRVTKGGSVMAACGQLGNLSLRWLRSNSREREGPTDR